MGGGGNPGKGSMHRNIIVQQGRIKPNDERFDLSSKTNR
jgi:hypothetical protein